MKLFAPAFLVLFFAVNSSDAADSPHRIWIDTEAACGAGVLKDITQLASRAQ